MDCNAVSVMWSNVHFFDQVKGGIPRCGTIDPKTVNNHDFCYQCSKDGTDILFGILRVVYKRYVPLPPLKKNTIPGK